MSKDFSVQKVENGFVVYTNDGSGSKTKIQNSLRKVIADLKEFMKEVKVVEEEVK